MTTLQVNKDSNERRERAQKIISDSKEYLSTNILTKELDEHINALKDQKMKLTDHQAIVILLDYAERELVAIDNLSKERPASLLQKFFKLFK